MNHAEVLITALLMAVAALGALACRLSVPYPIPLVIGGALAGFLPGLPDITLESDLVLALFLPRCSTSRRSMPTSATSVPACAVSP